MGINFVPCGGYRIAREVADAGDEREKAWRGNQVRLLVRAIQTLGLEQEAFRKPIIENSKAGAKNCLCRRVLVRIQTPGKAHPWRKVGMIGNARLRFPAQPHAEGHAVANFPVILRIEPHVQHVEDGERVSSDDLKLAGPARLAIGSSTIFTRLEVLFGCLVGSLWSGRCTR